MSFREERIGDCRLILGDCLEVMPTLGPVDAVVTDPPYGIKHKAHSNTALQNGKPRQKSYADKTILGDDVDFDPSPFLEFPEIILWGANHYAQRLPRGRWLVWNKLGAHEPWDSFSDVEIAWHNKRGSDRIFSLLWKGLAQAEKVNGGIRYHPTMKPIGLMQWCLGFLPDAQTILDPFMGSGTTLVACAKLGRRGIGIEIDPDYFEIAVERVKRAYEQPDLFIPAPRQVFKQGDMFDD